MFIFTEHIVITNSVTLYKCFPISLPGMSGHRAEAVLFPDVSPVPRAAPATLTLKESSQNECLVPRGSLHLFMANILTGKYFHTVS